MPKPTPEELALAWKIPNCNCRGCEDGLRNYSDWADKKLNLPFTCPDKGHSVLVEGLSMFKAPQRLKKDNNPTAYDRRVPTEKSGSADTLTLYVSYGRRECDHNYNEITKESKNCNHRWVPENARQFLQKYVLDVTATHVDFRCMLEAKNDMSIYFHRWRHGASLDDTFDDGDVVQVERSQWRVFDIGEYEDICLANALGRHFLQLNSKQTRAVATPSQVMELEGFVRQLAGAAEGGMWRQVKTPLLKEKQRHALVAKMDVHIGATTSNNGDYKLSLTRVELEEILSVNTVDRLVTIFGHRVDDIKLRCVVGSELTGQSRCIDWHVDAAKCTMQVALNDDDEYDGGSLCFLQNGAISCPHRSAGSATIHDGTVVHGVSAMGRRGRRYGLFFLSLK